MASGAPPDARPPLWRRRLVRLALLAGVLGGVLYVARDRLVWTPLARAGAGLLARDSGLELHFDELRAEGVSRVELSGVELVDRRNDPPRARGQLATVALSIRPWALVRGDLRGLLSIEVADGWVEVDVRGFPPSPKEAATEPVRPVDLPPVAVQGVDLLVTLGGGERVEARGLSVDLRARGDDRDLELAAGELSFAGTEESSWSGVSASGSWSSDELALTALAAEGLARPLDLRLALDRAGLPSAARLQLELEAGTLHARTALGAGVAPLIEFEFDLTDLRRFFGADRAWLEALSDRALDLPPDVAALAGAVTIDGRFDLGSLTFDGQLACDGLVHDGYPELVVDARTQVVGSTERVRLAAISATLADGGATLVAPQVELDATRRGALALLTAASGSVSLSLPAGSPVWDLITPPSTPHPHVELRVTTADDEPGVTIENLRATLPGAAFDLATGEVELLAAGDGTPAWRYAVDGTLAVDDSRPALAAAGLVTATSGSGSARLSVAGVGPDFDALLDGEIAAIDLGPWLPAAPALDRGALTLRARGAPGRPLTVDLLELELEAGDDLVTATGALAIGVDESAELTITALDGWARVGDLSVWSADLPAFAFETSVGGNGPLSAPRLRAGIGWRDASRPGSLSGDAIVTWEGERIEVEQAGVLVEGANLDGNGRVTLDGDGGLAAEVDALTIGTDGGQLELTAPASFAVAADGSFTVEPFQLAGTAGAARVVREPSGAWNLALTGVPAGDLASPWLPAGLQLGRLEGDLELTAPGDERILRGSFVLDEPTWRGVLPTRGGEDRPASAVADRARLDLAFEFDANGTVAGGAGLELFEMGTEGLWPGAVTADAAGSGRASILLDRAGVAQFNLDLAPDRRIDVELSGVARFGSPLRGWPDADDLAGAQLEAAGRGQLSSLGPLSGRIDALRAVEGRLVLDRIALGGTLARPELEVDAQLSDGYLRLGGDLPPIRALGGPLSLVGDRLELRELTGEAGAAPLRLGGSMTLGSAPTFDLTLVGDNVLLLRQPDLSLRGDVKLALSGPITSALLAGDVVLRNSRYTRDVDFLGLRDDRSRPSSNRSGVQLFSLREPPMNALRFDLAIASAPGDPFVVRTNVVRGTMRPDLRLVGTGEVPQLVGPIFLDPTRVSLPSTTLRTTGGAITFDESDPFTPRLDLRGETRMRGFDLTVVVTGDYDDPELLVTTVPPLSDKDALLLLATGQPPESALSGGGGVQTAQMLAVFLAQDIGSQFFGTSSEGDDGLLDRFEAFVGRDVSKTGLETVEVQFRLLEDWLVEGDRLFLTGERDVYEDVNGGLRLLFRFR